MEPLDLFATKGIEYVLVIGYLALLVACRRMVGPRKDRETEERAGPAPRELQAFKVPDGVLFHQGHSWAVPSGEGRMRVGLDDFAQKLLGPITGVIPPPLGQRLAQGEPGARMQLERTLVPVLSPVDGEVVGWNREILTRPELVNEDPYGEGWLMEVKVTNPVAARRNLLTGPLAHAWMDEAAERLERMATLNHGKTSFGGASGAVGLARLLTPQTWMETARRFLLTGEETDVAPTPPAEAEEGGRDAPARV